MGQGLRRAMLLATGLMSMRAFGGAKWTQPTADELKMTADPAAPGASAVYLFLEETTDDEKHERTYYARIKILSDDGKQYGDVTMPFWAKQEWIRGVEGRTIHSDGSVVPFSGKPWQKELIKAGGVREMEKGFSMPDVQVGSILEFRYTTAYEDWQAPQWYLQQPIFVHAAHYYFRPGGNGLVLATRFLPPKAQVDEKKGFDLRVADVPSQVEEEDSPPMRSLGYRLLFYYVNGIAASPEQFWANTGAYWSQQVNTYLAPDALKPVVAQLMAPGDSDEQKLRKIYAAVMKLENTTFTREHNGDEDKADKRKVTSVADVWQQRRGNHQQLALLFIAMARAAGFDAWAMYVTNRDENAFSKNETDWDQLDDEIAIVKLGGIETYFDPGQPYCTFAQLHWKHTWTMGVRQNEKSGTELAQTPYPDYKNTDVKRSADLKMDADGQVHGTIRIVMTGAEALSWRQEALTTDAEATKKDFHDTLATVLPASVAVQVTGLGPLDDGEAPLTATLDVSGTMGTRTGRRLFLPGSFFEAQAKPRFSSTTRQNPVYLHFAYSVEDELTLTLPQTASPESVPKDGAVTFSPSLNFDESYKATQNVYHSARREKVAQVLFQKKDYPDLRDFFQKVNAQDQEQLVVVAAPDASAAMAGKSD
jgi:hypothetical protein